MLRFALIIPLLLFSTPSVAADLDGPIYRERDVVIERRAAPVVRERIIERDYYTESVPPPSYRVRAYEPIYSYAPEVYYYTPGYAYDEGFRWKHRRPFFVNRPYRWHGHYHHRW